MTPTQRVVPTSASAAFPWNHVISSGAENSVQDHSPHASAARSQSRCTPCSQMTLRQTSESKKSATRTARCSCSRETRAARASQLSTLNLFPSVSPVLGLSDSGVYTHREASQYDISRYGKQKGGTSSPRGYTGQSVLDRGLPEARLYADAVP
jgi:hypothetical protein